MKVLGFTALCFLPCLVAFTQFTFPEKTIAVSAIGINKGLSQGMINAIYQDHFGFMWFGTMDGLNRYDGYKFHVFRNNPADTTTISGNFITSIFEDSRKRLWIGTALNGINLYLPESEQFIRFTTNTQPALSNNFVLSIQEDKLGSIWIGTQAGLNKLTVQANNRPKLARSKNSKETLSFSIKQVPIRSPDGAELFKVDVMEPSFLIAKSGLLWAATPNGLFTMMPQKNGEEKVQKTNLPFSVQSTGNKSSGVVYKIIEDTTTGLICFKGNSYLTILNQKTGDTFSWRMGDLDLSLGRNQAIFYNGVLWERTSKGLFCFSIKERVCWRMRSENAEMDKILGTPFSLYQDRSGILWIGTGGFGLLKYNPRSAYFHKTTTKSVTGITPMPNGDVLVMFPDLNYFKKVGTTGQPEYKPDPAFRKEMLRVTKQPSDIAMPDKDGGIWINLKGIATYNPSNKSYRFVRKYNDIVFSFFLDRSNRFWYAVGTHLYQFDKKSQRLVSYPFPVAQTASYPYQFCQVIYQDANGMIWLGTMAGLFRFTEATGQWAHYQNKRGDSTSLSTDIVFSICDDPSFPGRYLWIGTNGGGLNRLCVQTGKFEQMGLKDGLTNMVVYGILPDADKRLWLSTNNGLVCVSPAYNRMNGAAQLSRAETTFRNYLEEDGLQSNEFNRNAYCKTVDGTVFFGGVNGFNYFNPKQMDSNRVVPGVVITELRIKNKPVTFLQAATTGKTLLLKPVYLTDAIEIPYADNMISFDFAALDFTFPEKNLYCYKMEGFDKEWIQSGNSNSATYTNLDPGQYTFTVFGSNSDGVWNKKGASIRLTILAPWHMTWWFRTSVLLLASGLMYAVFRYRLNQRIRLFELRNGIASDLHDEIGSALNSVYIYSEVAQQTPGNISPQVVNYLKQISDNTGNTINALSDIVWTINSKNDEIETLINRMRSSAVELFEAKGYSIHLQFANEVSAVKLGMEKRKNFYLFYKEAINNAAKHAGGKNIWIELFYKKPFLGLRIKDDGRGFVVENERSGNGLENMKKRAAQLGGQFQLTTAPGAGTTIRLSFTV